MSEEIMSAASILRQNADLEAEASALRLLATDLVVELRIARADAYGSDHAETADVFDLAASILDNRRAGQPLLEEVARLRADNACLVAEVHTRAEKDAEDTHRLQGYCASLLAELEAARAVVAALRKARSTLNDAWPETRDLRRALAAYDKATKASK